jgi:hypothetical protein
VITSSLWVMVSVMVAAALILIGLVILVDLNLIYVMAIRTYVCVVLLPVSLNNVLGINSIYYVILKFN